MNHLGLKEDFTHIRLYRMALQNHKFLYQITTKKDTQNTHYLKTQWVTGCEKERIDFRRNKKQGINLNFY